MLMNLDRTAAILAEEKLDAVILSVPGNVMYGADYASEFMLGRFEDFIAAVVLVATDPGNPTLIIPEFDLPYHVENPGRARDVQLYGNSWSSVGVFIGDTLERSLDSELRRALKAQRDRLRPRQKESFLDALTHVLHDRGLNAATLGFDDLRLAEKMRGTAGRELRDATQTMRRIRMVKTPAEVEILSQGAKINADALRAVIVAGHAGLPEDELIRVFRMELTRNDARYLGERGMMFGTGDASSFSLPASAERKLTAGDAIVLDCLGSYRGYFMDLARTGIVGEPTKDQRHRYDAVLAALLEVENAIEPGVHTQDLRALTRKTIEGFDLRGDLVSVTTHGLGIEVFEFPAENSLKDGFLLELGNVVNTEVFYRDPDLGSFHLEDSVQVTETGCRLLYEMERDLVVFA